MWCVKQIFIDISIEKSVAVATDLLSKNRLEFEEKKLDRYEGYPYHIKWSMLVTLTESGYTVLAMAHVMVKGRKAVIPPTKRYYDAIAKGYNRFGFDKAILEKSLK